MPNKNKVDKRTKVYSLSNIELRSVEQENSDEMLVEGYAIVWNKSTPLYEDWDGTVYYEQIDRYALEGAIMEDVPFKYNHDDRCFVPCRSRIAEGEGSLRLTVDDHGLKIRGIFANTQASRDLYRLIQLGLINKMSFAFTEEESSYNRETRTTTILKIEKLWDVSAVDDPAYPQTSLSSLRCAEEAKMDMAAKVNESKLDNEEETTAQEELDNSELTMKREALRRKVKISALLSKL